MNIQDLSVGLSQQKVSETASIMMEGKILDGMKEQGQALTTLINSAVQVISDPALGNQVNTLA